MPEHYFSADPSVPFERESFTAELWGNELTIDTGSGVFSRGHLDHATAVLFRELEPPVQGQFLDLGCGYGVIGLAIARAVPLANVTGVDVNERALLLANENAKAAGLDSRFVACTPEQVREQPGLRRDLVQPADPHRQGGAPRAAAHLAAAAGAGRADGDGGRQEPRRRLAPALARRAGLADRRGSAQRTRASGCWRRGGAGAAGRSVGAGRSARPHVRRAAWRRGRRSCRCGARGCRTRRTSSCRRRGPRASRTSRA